MEEELFKILLTLIPVLCTIITYFIIPYIKTNIDSSKLNQYKEWANLAVKTAEMIWRESGHGEDKKQYVVSFLNDMFNKNKIVITEEQINVLIEACVKQMKIEEDKN